MNTHPRDAMSSAGIWLNDELIVDGSIHRFKIEGKRAKNGWYVFHEKDGKVFGAFGDWATGESHTFGGRTPEIKRELRKVADRSVKKAERASEIALRQWSRAVAMATTAPHTYLLRKQVASFGLRIADDRDGKLLVPMYRGGALVGLQSIDSDGQKRFTPGMKKLGSWFEIHGVGSTYVLCEGYATGASIHMATRLPVLVAFDCGNLLPAARDYASINSGINWIVAADNDQKTVGNPGLTKAFEATHELRGRIAVPLGTSGTDFNDLQLDHGSEAVVSLIYGCL